VRYRREVPFAALGHASRLGAHSPQYRHALRDMRRVLWSQPKSRRRVNGRLVKIEVRP